MNLNSNAKMVLVLVEVEVEVMMMMMMMVIIFHDMNKTFIAGDFPEGHFLHFHSCISWPSLSH
jgi:hypothetical protein